MKADSAGRDSDRDDATTNAKSADNAEQATNTEAKPTAVICKRTSSHLKENQYRLSRTTVASRESGRVEETGGAVTQLHTTGIGGCQTSTTSSFPTIISPGDSAIEISNSDGQVHGEGISM